MNPYSELPDKAYWKLAVSSKNMFDITELWDPKFNIQNNMKTATFGSCFAQHIGNALRARNYNWYVAEAVPPGLSQENAKKFNYEVFSARTGNIYTVSLLKQWVSWCVGEKSVPDEVWEKDGRFYDPFRPNIEPNGFESKVEMVRSREVAIKAFKACLTEVDVFVFTLGLTESWFNKAHGYEYPMCPGTVAGEFDPASHEFRNPNFMFIRNTLDETISQIKKVNPKIKILLTVSPVPLTATMSGNHVLVATMESKSILRSVAAMITRKYEFVDYFPSYEIINAAPFKGTFFEANQRSVNHSGVDHVMSVFFNSLHAKFRNKNYLDKNTGSLIENNESSDEVVCEEELLEAFGGKP